MSSYQRGNFLGGIWSQAMQGRTEKPEYVTALNDCLNHIVTETGCLPRRSGTQVIYGATTRGGIAGRVVKFDFQQTSAYTIELTDGHLRFIAAGGGLVTTNDTVGVSSISSANPAVVTMASAVTWATGDQAFFSLSDANTPLIQNRVFALTKVDTTHFSLADAVTGSNIDGSTLNVGSLNAATTISRVLDIATPYVGGGWAALRVVQCDFPVAGGIVPGAVLLHASYPPQVLQVATEPTDSAFATFTFGAASFQDGPYFDPVPGGVQASPSGTSGIINLTLSAPAYSSTTAYTVGNYVSSGGINYISIADANLNNTPASSASFWTAVDITTVIGALGFQATDVGRHVRLYSEPAIWASGTTYAKGNVVAYGGSGLQYTGASYWQSNVNSNTGNIPGTDAANATTPNWVPANNATIWTWGKITALLNEISRSLSGSVNIGDMTANGGLAAAFDGTTSQTGSACAAKSFSSVSEGDTLTNYVGKNYFGASSQIIQQGTLWPASDFGFDSRNGGTTTDSVTINLRAKASAPASSSDGTLLGTATVTNSTAPVTIVSNDQATSWNYVWFEIVATAAEGHGNYVVYAAEVKFFNPPGTGTSSGCTVEILSNALLYTTPIRTWRLGLYSNTTGWPTVGTYHEGRLWLFGVVDNRVDASSLITIDGAVPTGIFTFTPTAGQGVVSAGNAISYLLNAPDVNPVFWAIPDDQGIVVGTKAGEWLIVPPTPGSMSPLNLAARRRTTIGCANIEPRHTEHTTVFVQKFGRKIMEYFPDVFSGRYTAPHLTDYGKHLTAPGIAEIAYQQELAPVVWARLTDGTLLGITYKRDTLMTSQGPTMKAMHRHVLGSGRSVESIAVGPSIGGNIDALTMVTLDSNSGVYHVEILQDLAEETTALAAYWLLDDATAPATTSTSNSSPAPYGGLTINGLWHLNGKTVTVWASGLDCGDFTVASGSITVPYGDGVSAGTANGLFTAAFAATATVVVGFTFTSQGQLVRPNHPQETGSRSGPGFGKLRRQAWYAIQVYSSVGGVDGGIGTDFSKLDPVVFKALNGQSYSALQPFTGIWRAVLRDTESLDSMIAWQVTRPRPWNVTALGGLAVETKDV